MNEKLYFDVVLLQGFPPQYFDHLFSHFQVGFNQNRFTVIKVAEPLQPWKAEYFGVGKCTVYK